ncbi:MAG: hypothetical protein AW07_01281 [Candidatus Accumulibacter sp. SK-11]|nr:MAG: hypothetical protein AW07_01281 [Candidatus Accumulibacter sp. SK-11]
MAACGDRKGYTAGEEPSRCRSGNIDAAGITAGEGRQPVPCEPRPGHADALAARRSETLGAGADRSPAKHGASACSSEQRAWVRKAGRQCSSAPPTAAGLSRA